MNIKLKEPGMECENRDRRAKGFTLTELVFVVLTCALLGCLVVPALATSRDGGKRAVCFNNLRQLGMSMVMYGNDNRDYLSPPNWDGGVAGSAPGWLYTVTNGVIPDPGPGGVYSSNPRSAYATGLWFSYTRDPRIYLCPVDIESWTYTTSSVSQRRDRLSSYIVNGAVCGYANGGRTCKLTDAWSPGCYLLWGPNENSGGAGFPGAVAFNDGSSYPNTNEGLIEQLHTETGGEILTVGGAVQFLSVQKFKLESGSSVKNLAYWSPFAVSGH
jgi:type II secretory pathway pseudopilin PulG